MQDEVCDFAYPTSYFIIGSQEMPMICLNSGACYQGSWMVSDAGNQYASFQGIRYAESRNLLRYEKEQSSR